MQHTIKESKPYKTEKRSHPHNPRTNAKFSVRIRELGDEKQVTRETEKMREICLRKKKIEIMKTPLHKNI